MSIQWKYVALAGLAATGLVFGGKDARADAVAYANLDITTASFLDVNNPEATLSDLEAIQVNSGGDTISASTAYGTYNGLVFSQFAGLAGGYTVSQTRSLGASNYVDSYAQSGTGGNLTYGNASLNGSLLSLGGVQSDTTSYANSTNGFGTGSTTAHTGTNTDVTFTATQSVTLQMTLGGTYQLYGSLSNSNSNLQRAAANISFTFTLTDVTTGAVQQFTEATTALGQSFSALGKVGSKSASFNTGVVSFSVAHNFNFTAGDEYILNISQDVSTEAYAVPEPATLALLGFGLAGFGMLGLRRRRLN